MNKMLTQDEWKQSLESMVKETNQKQVVYVLMEEDRGCGATIVGVYANKEQAEAILASNVYRYTMFEREVE